MRRHRLAVEIALLALISYLAAVGVSATVRNRLDALPPSTSPDGPVPRTSPAPLADYAVIAARDVFNPARNATASGPARELRLWGVAIRGREPQAVIEDPATRRQDLYRVGDRVGGQRVAAIDWDRVTLTGSGGETTLELASPRRAGPQAADAPPEADAAPVPAVDPRIRRTAENTWLVDRRELAGAADNMSGLLTQLRAVAEMRDGRPAGFRLFQIRDGSLFSRLGLHDGDVIQRVNGSPVTDPAALLAFLQRLQSEQRVALDIVRSDAPRTLVYDLR